MDSKKKVSVSAAAYLQLSKSLETSILSAFPTYQTVVFILFVKSIFRQWIITFGR